MPRVRKLVLSETQRAELEGLRDRHPKAYLRERAAALLKVADGMSGVAVARTGLYRPRSEEAVYRWLDRYAAEGVAGLLIRAGRGRKPAFPPQSAADIRQAVEGLVHQPPSVRGHAFSRWTLALLRREVAGLRPLSLSGVWKVLWRLGIRYKRGGEHLHSPDPAYHRKLATIAALRAEARQSDGRIVLLYQDEMTYYRRPSVQRAYARRGHDQARVELGHSRNRKRRLSGSLDVGSGRFFARQRASFGKHALIRYYQALAAEYPHAQSIYLVQDNWPVHFLPDVVLAARQSRIELIPLPTYAPWTNPVEKVWLRLKREVLHHHPFVDDWTALTGHVQRWLSALDQPSPDLLHQVGLLPP